MDREPATETAINQPPPFGDINLASLDTALLEHARTAGYGDELLAFGAEWGSLGQLTLGRLANEHPPVLHAYDPQGRRCDQVEFHPAYHALMGASMAGGLHALSWDEAERPAHARRAARLYLTAQVEAGHICPLTMTHAAPAALAAAPRLPGDWLPRIRSRRYDARFLPFWEKTGVTLGMGMTEKQGGSDLRANLTRAVPIGGDEYEISGHKWFFSAPMSDAFLVLAQVPTPRGGGLTCFLMPRFRPDGGVNGLQLLRLKDKLGNRSNASAEVEFERAFAWRVGEEGRGVATILKMVQLTRLDCAVASAGLMRMALAQAVHHARHRTAFGKSLLHHPAMALVLADLALEAEAATALVLRLAASFDETGESGEVRVRLLTPAVKFAVCKLAPGFIFEAMEALGGNGYVELSPLPRLYREAPVNAIWEGSGNVIALDLLRAARREPAALQALVSELEREADGLPGVEAAARELSGLPAAGEAQARRAALLLANLAATAALAGSAPAAVTQAFARTRLAQARAPFGANAVEAACDLLLERALAA